MLLLQKYKHETEFDFLRDLLESVEKEVAKTAHEFRGLRARVEEI